MPPAKIREVGSDGIAFETATPASQPGDVFPSGVIMPYAGSAAPTNWLIADGSAVSRSTYANLFAAISTTFGTGDGSTTFNLPDLRDKVPVGKSGAKALGSTGGEETHILSVNEMPSHNHGGVTGGGTTGFESADHAHLYVQPGGIIAVQSGVGAFAVGNSSNALTGGRNIAHTHQVTPLSISSHGGDVAHNNLQPYVALNYIIKT